MNRPGNGSKRAPSIHIHLDLSLADYEFLLYALGAATNSAMRRREDTGENGQKLAMEFYELQRRIITSREWVEE